MNKNYFKFTIDLIMAVMFFLFFNSGVFGGLAYHEIAGLVFAVIFFTHILLNVNWVKNVTIKIFDRNLPWKTRGNYALNLLLLLLMSFVIFSGIIISRVVFPNIHLGNESWFRTAHITFSFLALIVVGIHVGIHWHWVVTVFQKMFRFKSEKKWLGYAAKIAVAVILIFGVYEIQHTGFVSQVANAGSLLSGSSSGTMAEHGDFNSGGGQKPAFANGQRPNVANGEKTGSPDGQRHDGNQISGGHDGGGASALNVIMTYSAIMAVFVVISYWIRKWLLRNRRKRLA
jgi:hypothetical protein